jgi:hypothetical protein
MNLGRKKALLQIAKIRIKALIPQLIYCKKLCYLFIKHTRQLLFATAPEYVEIKGR